MSAQADLARRIRNRREGKVCAHCHSQPRTDGYSTCEECRTKARERKRAQKLEEAKERPIEKKRLEKHSLDTPECKAFFDGLITRLAREGNI